MNISKDHHIKKSIHKSLPIKKSRTSMMSTVLKTKSIRIIQPSRNKIIEIGKIILYYLLLYSFYFLLYIAMWHLYWIIKPIRKPHYNDTVHIGPLMGIQDGGGEYIELNGQIIKTNLSSELVGRPEANRILCIDPTALNG